MIDRGPGEMNLAKRYVAEVKMAAAKRKMDKLQAELDQAEDEWHQACKELDDINATDD